MRHACHTKDKDTRTERGVIMDMWTSFLAFNKNAISNIIFVIQSNYWFVLMLMGVIGTIALNMKAEIDRAVSDEQNII